MKLFKKFLLAAGLIGLVGTFGFTSKVQAADDVIVTIDSVANTATIKSVSGNQVTLTAGGKEIYTGTNATVSTNGITVTEIIEKANGAGITGDVATISVTVKDENGWAKSADASTKLYLVKVTASANGTVSPSAGVYRFPGNSVTFTASPNSNYVVDKWDNESSTSTTKAITVSDNATTNTSHTVTFAQSSSTTIDAELTYTITRANGTTETGPVITKESTSARTIKIYDGETVRLGVNDSTNVVPKIQSGATEGSYSISGSVLTGKTSGTVRVKAEKSSSSTATVNESAALTIEILPWTATLTNFADYLSRSSDDTGFTMEFTSKTETAVAQNWVITEGSDFAEIETSMSDDKKTATVKIKAKGDVGYPDNSDDNWYKSVKIKCQIVINSTAYDAKISSSTSSSSSSSSSTSTSTESTKTIKIYPKHKLEYNSSNRTLTYWAAPQINTGNKSGGDGSSNVTKISDTKGVKMDIYANGTLINNLETTLKNTTTNGNKKKEISQATIEHIVVLDAVQKKLRDDNKETGTITFKTYPCDNDKKYNNNVSASQDATVYKVVITATGAAKGTSTDKNTNAGGGVATLSPLPVALISPVGSTVATADSTNQYVVYLLPDQTFDPSELFPALKGAKYTDAAGNSSTTITGSSTTKAYTAVLGTKTADTAPDGQQKWGQGNIFAYIMMILVICGVCAGLYALNRKKSNI